MRPSFVLSGIITQSPKTCELLVRDIQPSLQATDIVTYDFYNGVQFYIDRIDDYTVQNDGHGLNGWTHRISCQILGDYSLPTLSSGTEFTRVSSARGEYSIMEDHD